MTVRKEKYILPCSKEHQTKVFVININSLENAESTESFFVDRNVKNMESDEFYNHVPEKCKTSIITPILILLMHPLMA